MPVAIVASERLLFASPRLAELTGYTVNELTSPEFRFSYLLPPDAMPRPGRLGETVSKPIEIVPLRGAARSCSLTAQLVAERPEPTMVVVLEPGAKAADLGSAAERAAGALVDGLRSALSREMVALRKLEERIWTMGVARGGALGARLHELARMHEEAAAIEAARVDLERRVGAIL